MWKFLKISWKTQGEMEKGEKAKKKQLRENQGKVSVLLGKLKETTSDVCGKGCLWQRVGEDEGVGWVN